MGIVKYSGYPGTRILCVSLTSFTLPWGECLCLGMGVWTTNVYLLIFCIIDLESSSLLCCWFQMWTLACVWLFSFEDGVSVWQLINYFWYLRIVFCSLCRYQQPYVFYEAELMRHWKIVLKHACGEPLNNYFIFLSEAYLCTFVQTISFYTTSK